MFYWLVTGENGTPATETAPPAGLIQECITLLACPAPCCQNTLHFKTTHRLTSINIFCLTLKSIKLLLRYVSQHVFFSLLKLFLMVMSASAWQQTVIYGSMMWKRLFYKPETQTIVFNKITPSPHPPSYNGPWQSDSVPRRASRLTSSWCFKQQQYVSLLPHMCLQKLIFCRGAYEAHEIRAGGGSDPRRHRTHEGLFRRRVFWTVAFETVRWKPANLLQSRS